MEIVRLPKGYYRYLNSDISALDKTDATESLTVSLSALVSCKLEQFALEMEEPAWEDLIQRRIAGDELVTDD